MNDKPAIVQPAPLAGDAAVSSRQLALWVLVFVSAMSTIDRQVMPLLLSPIQKEFQLTDGESGLLGFVFGLFFGLGTIPLAMLADRRARRKLISLCLGGFSACTWLCGLAPSFAWLVGGRIGVAAGEAAVTPAAHSMIADLFPPAERSFAMAKFVLGSKIGAVVAYLLGGWLSDWFGWRNTFIIIAIPGLLVALAAWRMREPPRGGSDNLQPAAARSFSVRALVEDLAQLRGNRTFWYLFFSNCAAGLFGLGAIFWLPIFLERNFGMPSGEAGTYMAVYTIVFGMSGVVIIGWIASKLTTRDIRWGLWILALMLAIALPSAWLMFFTTSRTILMFAAMVPMFVSSSALGPVAAMIQTVVPVGIRSTSAGIMQVGNGISLAMGPLIVGLISQFFSSYGEQSIRYALLSLSTLWVLTLIGYLLASRSLKRDIATANPASLATDDPSDGRAAAV